MTEEQETIHFLDYWRVIRSRKEVIIAVALLVVLTGILVTYSMPKVYRASTIIAVRQDAPDVEVFTRQISGYDPLFMRTQFEIIQSRPIIEETIRKQNLDERLANAYGYAHLPDRFERTVKLLRRSMKVQQYRDTNLIEIQIYLAEPKDKAPEEAARMANTVASVFRDQRTRAGREESDRAMKALYASLEEQRKRVADSEKEVERIREDYQITVVSMSAGSDSAIDKQGLLQLEAYRRRVRVDLAEKEARLTEIRSLSPQELLDAAPMLGDAMLAQLVNERRKSEVELSRLSQSYGLKHPRVLDVEAGLSELNVKIGEALDGLKTGFRVDYQAEKAKLDIIEAELKELQTRERERESGAYLEFSRAQADLAHARSIRDSLEARYIQEQIEMRIPRSIVEVIQPAVPPSVTDPVSPDITLNMILSIVVGLMAGVGLAYFIEYLDTSVKTVEDVERSMGVPVLGVIPQKVKPMVDEEADAAHAEAYRILRTNIRFSKRVKDGKTYTITSGSAGEGKSLTLFNLAYVAARLGERVVIVDSDLHRPTQHKLLKTPKDVGLANILVGGVSVDEAVIHTTIQNLDFIPSGRLSSGYHGLLDTLRMKELVDELRKRYDLILFDAPPITGVSDASLLAREMDGVLLVIQHRKHPKAVSTRAKAMIENVGANLIGVVLNNINISRDYSYYYYGHYYSYAYTRSRQDTAQGDKKS